VIRFLDADEVREANAVIVGQDSLRDEALLKAAVGRPMISVGGSDAYPTIHEKAAALLESLARNHAFVDGNKRTALAATGVFYLVNGFSLNLEQGDAVRLVMDVVAGAIELSDVAEILKGAAHNIVEID
jgi:death-on-curing protein